MTFHTSLFQLLISIILSKNVLIMIVAARIDSRKYDFEPSTILTLNDVVSSLVAIVSATLPSGVGASQLTIFRGEVTASLRRPSSYSQWDKRIVREPAANYVPRFVLLYCCKWEVFWFNKRFTWTGVVNNVDKRFWVTFSENSRSRVEFFFHRNIMRVIPSSVVFLQWSKTVPVIVRALEGT